ncbi:MAG: hypothetical protein LBH44_07445, partial [Treponema sp.]|nr:hypothetical protein [Treponema sp.]
MEQLTKKQLAYEALLSRLQGIDALSNEEISKLSWDVASTKGICSEGGKFYKAFFSSTEFKEKIIEFSEKYCINDYVLRNLIIVMGMSAMRLDEFDDRYYQFFLKNINNNDKKIKRQIR